MYGGKLLWAERRDAQAGGHALFRLLQWMDATLKLRLIIVPPVLSLERRAEAQTVTKNDKVNWAYLREAEDVAQVMSFGKERERTDRINE